MSLDRIILGKITKFLAENKPVKHNWVIMKSKLPFPWLYQLVLLLRAIRSLQNVKCNPLPALVVMRQNHTHWVC